MHRELDPEFAAVSERGFRTPVANISWVTAILERSNIRMCVKHFFTRRGSGSSWISKTRCLLSGRNAWVRVGARLTAERLADALDLSLASTTTTFAEARPLAGGSSHLQGIICDRPIISLLQKTCASTSMKAVMPGP
jgi:hypothetical protein